MPFLKNLLKNKGPKLAASWLAANYIQLIKLTGRWRIDGTEIPTDMLKEGKPFLVAFWHGRLLMMSLAWPYQQNFKMVISRHRDGELIARTIKFLGFDSISGSSSRGGAGSMRSILRALKSGEYVGVTPDGPRGPRMRAAKGIVFAACHAGVPILPLSYAARSCKTLTSWDRFLIPLPFCRGIIRWGKPIAITSNADEKEILQKTSDLEKQLNFLTNQLDDELGLDRVTPETETKL